MDEQTEGAVGEEAVGEEVAVETRAAPRQRRSVPQTAVQRAASAVARGARSLRVYIAALAAARSETSELTSEDWEAIQEANIALGQVPRPS